ncbi:hypothetical protein QL285_057646 [Trifolium repens]|nr:hypothetical protein QL285_057646 [Trifolium repens]
MKGVPESIEERDPTPLGKQISFTGEEIAYYHTSDSMSRQHEKMRHYLLSNKVIACQDNDTDITYYHTNDNMPRQYENMEHYLLSNKVIACQDNDRILPTTIQMIECQGNIKR